MIGTTISQYKILEEIGRGGMGVVYKAEDTKLDRIVALKFLPAHLSGSEQDKARFIQEAKAAAALNHPNVCSIIDIANDDGKLFIVMEFVDGQTLREKFKSQVPNPRSAIDIGIQIAEGLAAAHEKGIVHRDIKPENIMIRKDGIAQIMDFGLAKLRSSGSKITRLTKEGSTLGTAGYMSPEQVQGQEADHRSDVFSLGVLMYELFTGRLPFQGAHETAMMYEIVNVDPPPPTVVRPELDPEVDRIILECLQKDPDERYNSAKDIAKDLKRFKRESSRQHLSRITKAQPVSSAAPSSHSAVSENVRTNGVVKRFAPWALVLFFVLSTIWGMFLRKSEISREVVKFTISAPDDSHMGTMIAISPDGKNIGYLKLDETGGQIYIRSLSDLSSRPLNGTKGTDFSAGSDILFFSPDGEWLGFVAGGKLKKIPVRGGSATTITNVANIRGATWCDDNTIIYTPASSGGIWRVSADGGPPIPISILDSAAGEISHRYPEVLPGSSAVLYTVKMNSITKFSEAKIVVQRLDTKEKKILIEGGSYVKYLSTGHLLYGQGGSVYVIPFDADRLELKGQPVKVLEGGMFVESFGSMTLAVSKSGTIVYAPGGPAPQDSNMIFQFDRKGNSRALLDAPGGYASVSISPDKTLLTYYLQAANDDVWMYDVRRRIRTRFTFAGGNNWYPLWSPDGKHIVYTAERGSPPNLFWKSTDGTGLEERLATGRFTQFASGWSPDGTSLVFHQANEEGNDDIWILSLDGDRVPRSFLHSKFSEQYGTISPDGRWMAYESNESGQWEIYATSYPAGEGKWQISTGGGNYPQWSKGGSEIIFLNFKGTVLSVPVTYSPAFRPGESKELFQLPDYPLYAPDVSSDGERISVALGGTRTRIRNLAVEVNWFEELKKQLF